MVKTSRLNGPMGIDLGVKELAVVCFNGKPLVFHNINRSPCVKKLERKLKSIQEGISLKSRRTQDYKKTEECMKALEEVRRLGVRLDEIRHDYVHMVTNQLVSLLPSYVVMENLDVKGMLKNKKLMKAIKEQCFLEFIQQMRHKCGLLGITFIQVPRYYPSSKTCSNCGFIKKDLRLSDRTFECAQCDYSIDRDFNAAINLIKYVEYHTALRH